MNVEFIWNYEKKCDGLIGNDLGMHMGCWGMNVEFMVNY